jgi:hypothetical protein
MGLFFSLSPDLSVGNLSMCIIPNAKRTSPTDLRIVIPKILVFLSITIRRR